MIQAKLLNMNINKNYKSDRNLVYLCLSENSSYTENFS